jgi:hypothetical protein
MQPGSHSADRAVDEIRYFLVAESLDVAQDNDRAKVFGQRFDGSGNVVFE